MEEIRASLPSAWASATVGSRSTAMELVMAEGNRMKGRAMLVSTPYTDRASEFVRPELISLLGIHMASALPRTFNIRRFPIRGRARAIRGAAVAPKERGMAGARRESPSLQGGKKPRQNTVNTADAISPIRCPYTARLTVIWRPDSSQMLAMRNTAPMRMTCSATWEKAGTRAFCMP